MKIPFFDYPRLFLDKKDDYMNIFSEVASRGAFILQSDVDIFEKKLSNFDLWVQYSLFSFTTQKKAFPEIPI